MDALETDVKATPPSEIATLVAVHRRTIVLRSPEEKVSATVELVFGEPVPLRSSVQTPPPKYAERVAVGESRQSRTIGNPPGGDADANPSLTRVATHPCVSSNSVAGACTRSDPVLLIVQELLLLNVGVPEVVSVPSAYGVPVSDPGVITVNDGT
jgi:hypothetical protein